MDGELSLAEPESLAYFNVRGIQRKVRAPSQHARYIERRGGLLRDQLHLIESQLKESGVSMPFKAMLNEAVFAGNALLTNDGVSPYIAVYGRTPPMVPEITAPTDADNGSEPGLTRNVQRIREIAIQKLIEATSRDRLNRALRTHTQTAGEEDKYSVGDDVDYYRPPGQKDISG